MTQSRSVRRQSGARGGRTRAFVSRVEAATEPGRDRYLDLVRVAAILMVILGHWLVRVVVAPEGEPQTGYLLALEPGWQWATLIWQVMPLIFLVGGALNAVSWRRARSDGVAPADWIRRRARRLLRPTVPLLLVVVSAWLAVDLLIPGMLLVEPGVALIPLWFVAAYLVVLALTPATLDLHERGWSLPAIVAAVMAAGILDALQLTGRGPVLGTQPLVALPNFLLIWTAIHQLGHLWADRQLPMRPAGQMLLVAFGAVALAILIGMAGWPLSMVPVEGVPEPDNAAPPTVALFALALVQIGVVLLAREPLRRALEQPVMWAVVAVLGARMMTLFLWHQVAMVVVTNLAAQLNWLPLSEVIDARWWAQQPLWLAAFAAALVGFVMAVGRFEDSGKPSAHPDNGGWLATVSGIVLVAGGIAGRVWLAVTAFPASIALVFLAMVLAGCRTLGALGQRAAC